MSEDESSIYKTLTFILLLALIGLYALYNWYQGTLKQDLSRQGSEMSETVQRLAEANGKIQAAAEAEQSLKGEMARIQGQSDAAQRDLDALKGRYASTVQELEATKGAIEDRDRQIAQGEEERKGLEAKLAAAADTEGQLKSEGEAAEKRIGELQDEVDALKRSLSEAEAKYAAQVKDLEASLKDRAERWRTAAEGSDAERAAQLAKLERQVEEGAKSLEETRGTLESTRSDLSGRLNAATALAEDRAKQLVDAKKAHEDALSESRGKIFGLEEEAQSAKTSLAALQQKLDVTVADSNRKLAEGAEALARNKAELEQLTAQAEAEKKSLQGQIADLEAQRQSVRGELDSVRAKVAELDANLEKTRKLDADALAKLKDEDEAALAAVKSQLTAAISRASQQKQELEARISALDGEKHGLEVMLESERQQAKDTHAADAQASAKALDEQRKLYTRYAELGGRQTERGLQLNVAQDELRFPKGGAVLPKGERPSLDRIAKLLIDYPSMTARIEGHTDNLGPDAINVELSQARAEAVKQQLIDRGVPEQRLTAEGLGETKPIADNSTAEGRSANRRVEVYVIQDAQ